MSPCNQAMGEVLIRLMVPLSCASRTDHNRPATCRGLTQIQNRPDLPTYEKRTP